MLFEGRSGVAEAAHRGRPSSRPRPVGSADFDYMRSHLASGRVVRLSCAQKVCLSGDYGDMHAGGQTFTASLKVRPYLELRALSKGPSRVTIRGRALESGTTWPLVEALRVTLAESMGSYHVDMFPTAHMNVGLGSSGAASVLLASVLAIADGSTPGTVELIQRAHMFENLIAEYPCGPQDHAAAVFGGLNLITYPELAYEATYETGAWRHLSFWTTHERRRAHELIPTIAAAHTSAVWEKKAELTRRVAAAFARTDIEDLADHIRLEAALQADLGMLTEDQSVAVKCIESVGGAAKVSGAGGGGILVVAAADRGMQQRIARQLRVIGVRPLRLEIDHQGLVASLC